MPEPQTVILGCVLLLCGLLWLIDEFLNAPIVDDDYDDHERKLIADMKRREVNDAA